MCTVIGQQFMYQQDIHPDSKHLGAGSRTPCLNKRYIHRIQVDLRHRQSQPRIYLEDSTLEK
jgi:hypothetical protein